METNDFVVKSMSHCFLCLDPISSVEETSSSYVNFKHHRPDIQSLSIYSLQNLSRFLKMDLGKVFNENELISQQLLDKVRKSKLKAELCEECVLLNNMFSEQYLKLEKIKMEMLSSLRLIQDRLLTAMVTDKSVRLRKVANSLRLSDPGDGWMGKLDILEVLRAEAMQKCYQKISVDTPRPKVQKLTMEQVNNKMLKSKQLNTIGQTRGFNSSFEAAPEIECRNMKREFSDPMAGDDDNVYHSDNLNMNDSDDSNGSVVNEREQNISNLKVEDHTKGQIVHSEVVKVIANKRRENDARVPSSSLSTSGIPLGSDRLAVPKFKFIPETGKYKCSLCPREFAHRGNFRAHHKSAHLGVKYKCGICRTEFTYRTAYNLHHRNVHMGVRFKCLGCSKLFTSKQTLKSHQLKHECKAEVTRLEK